MYNTGIESSIQQRVPVPGKARGYCTIQASCHRFIRGFLPQESLGGILCNTDITSSRHQRLPAPRKFKGYTILASRHQFFRRLLPQERHHVNGLLEGSCPREGLGVLYTTGIMSSVHTKTSAPEKMRIIKVKNDTNIPSPDSSVHHRTDEI